MSAAGIIAHCLTPQTSPDWSELVWDQSRAGTGIIISGTNGEDAERDEDDVSPNYVTVYATQAITGKKFWTVENFGFTVSGAVVGIGLAQNGLDLESATEYTGFNTTSCSMWIPNCTCFYNDAQVANYADLTGPKMFAVDTESSPGNVLVWVGVDDGNPGGIWFQGDPAAGSDPTFTLPAGTYYPCGTWYIDPAGTNRQRISGATTDCTPAGFNT